MAGSCRPSRLRALCAFAIGVALAASLVSPAGTLAASLVSPAAILAGGVQRSVCPVGMACNTAIGVAVRLPRGWTVEPPGHSAFNSLGLVTIVPGRQNMDLHMGIEPFGTTTARDPLAGAEAGADAATQGVTMPITRTAMTVAGLPAVRLRGLGGAPGFGQEIVVAHGGLLYGIYTFDDSRTAFTPGQRQALASLRFIPRHGPALRPYGTNALVAALYNPCLDLQRTAPAAVPAAARLKVSFSISPARGNEMVAANVMGTGFRPGQEMVLTACWNRAVHPTYTLYHKIAHVHANRYGALPAPIATPTFVMSVPSGSFKSWDVRVVATDARTGQRLAAVAVGPSASAAAPDVRALRLLSERPLTHDGRARFVAWGPRGHLLLYLDRGALWLSDVSGRKHQELVGGPVADAAFTADGTHILYRPITAADMPGAIVRINLHGGDRRRLVGPDYQPVGTSATASSAVGLAASILQDGRVALQRAGRHFVLDPQRDTVMSFGAVRLPALPTANTPPSWWTAVAPNGTRVAIFTASGELTIRDVRTGRLLRRVVPAGGQLVPGAGLLPVTSVSWSPDDHVLVYELGGPGGALKALDVGTGRAWTLLRVHLDTLSGFTWSPDGSTLAFSDVETGTNVGPMSEIELINADGSELRMLDPQATRPNWVQAHVPGQTDPLWSPSGRAIGYTRIGGPMNGTRPFQTNVWLADLRLSSSGRSRPTLHRAPA